MVKPKDHEIRKKILREIVKHPGIKISEIAKNLGKRFQVVNKILKEPEMSKFVKSTINIKENSNIMSYLTFETLHDEVEESIIDRYEDILDIIEDNEEEQKRCQEEMTPESKQKAKRFNERMIRLIRAEKVQKSNDARI